MIEKSRTYGLSFLFFACIVWIDILSRSIIIHSLRLNTYSRLDFFQSNNYMKTPFLFQQSHTFYGANNIRTNRIISFSLSMSTIAVPPIYIDSDSERLKKAKLRLAEAQGVIPIGGSDSYFQALNQAQAAGSNDSHASTMAMQVRLRNSFHISFIRLSHRLLLTLSEIGIPRFESI